jgi:hypothetical protein
MSNAPILSIVIPTKNRQPYLAKLLRCLLMMESRDFEVIVHDNSDDRSLYDKLCGGIIDPRLRYFYSPGSMSMTENCERGIGLAEGSYVCMIGDDDGVTESLVDVARWMKSIGVDAAVAAVPTYLWPGVSSKLDGEQTHGILRLPRYSGRIQFIDESAALDRVLSSGGIRIADLPSVYQGVISKRALVELKRRAGTYFPGPSPDMANAVGLSAVIVRFVKIDLPLVISGSCPSSGAAEGARHGHEGEIADKPFLSADTAATWPREVPYYFSGPTLYASSVIRALLATQRAPILQQLRFDRLYAACAVFNPRYRGRVAEARAKNATLVSSPAFLVAIGWIWWLRAKILIKNLRDKAAVTKRSDRRAAGLPDIGAAVEYVMARFGRDQFRALVINDALTSRGPVV